MSATIEWTPVEDGTPITVFAPSAFINSIEKVFGSFPVTLGKSNIENLRVMAAMHTNDEPENPYEELIEAIEKHGDIRVFAIY